MIWFIPIPFVSREINFPSVYHELSLVSPSHDPV